MNYEQIRAAVREAVGGALPTSPDDGTVVVRFDHGEFPIWGAPTGVVEAITTAVMQALYPAPVSLPGENPEPTDPLEGDPIRTGRWSCGCDSSQCKLTWSVGRDASTDPSQVIRVTCITHSIWANSESARCSANQGMRQQAQALHKLDLAHQEQCR